MESSPPSSKQPSLDGTEVSTSNLHPSQRNPAPRFRARKRSQKARKKRSVESSKHEHDDEEGISKADLLLIKDVQAMREKARLAALDTVLSGRKRKLSPQNAQTHNDGNISGALALRNDFAVERSNNIMEEHMNKYIDEGIRKKFGEEQVAGNQSSGHELNDDNLYAIPEHLKFEQRQQYDPGEGMPTAGVEEIELPEHVRRKNEIETMRARDKFKDQSNTQGRPASSNSARVEHDPQSHPSANRDTLNNSNSASNQEKPEHSLHATLTDTDDTKKKRFRHATDHLVADRFRKRWRR